MNLFGQLAPGLAASHHQHRAGRQSGRIGVFLREELHHVPGKRFRARGAIRELVRAGRHHHGASLDRAGAQRQEKSSAVRLDLRDGAVSFDWRVKRIGPRLDVIDELRELQKPIWIRPVVFRAGQVDEFVGRDQAERVPAPRPPGLRDAAGLEHHVVDLGLREVPAGRKPGLPSADDRDVDVALHDGGNRNREPRSKPIRPGRPRPARLSPLAIRGRKRRGLARPARR